MGTENQEARETHSQFAERLGAKMDAEAAELEKKATPAGTPKQAVDEEAAAEEEAEKGTPTEAVAEVEGAEAEGEDEEDTEVEGEDPDEEELDGDFKRAAAKSGLPTGLEDIPEEARPLVQKRLKAMESGFTRAMMEQREYRAEEKFRAEHPVDFIADLLLSDPELEEKVSGELEKRGDETYRESRKIISDKAREDAAKAVDSDRQAEVRREQRITQVESLTERACTQYGVPYRAVEAAIANAIITSDTGDIDDREIAGIVRGIAKEIGVVSRKQLTEEGKERVKGKLADRAGAPRIRPGHGRSAPPAVAAGAKQTTEEKMRATVAAMFPGAD